MLFTPDMFTCADLTAAVNKLPYVPTLLRQFFEGESIRTTTAVIDLESTALKLVADSKRGNTGSLATQNTRKAISVPVPHLSQIDSILPEDVQDVRAFGTTEPETIAMRLAKKQANLRRNIEATMEWHRLGAVKGKIYDADGATELLDLFTAFGVSQTTKSITWPTSAGTDVVLAGAMEWADAVDTAMGGNPYSGIYAICGSTFWEKLVTNPITRDAYVKWYSSNSPRFGQEPFLRGAFEFGGITFIRYNKAVGGNTMVEATKCNIFPVGTGIFKTIYAPADYVETVNTDGMEFYSKLESKPFGKGYDLEVQSNPLCLCMFPSALIEVTGS